MQVEYTSGTKEQMIEAIRFYWPIRSHDLARRRIKSAIKLLRA